MERDFDSAKYIDKKDADILGTINTIKKDITSYFDIEKFIDKLRVIIDDCPDFEFRSVTAKKFIRTDKPTFVLKMNKELLEKLKNSNLDLSKKVDKVSQVIAAEIISEISVFITDCLIDSDKSKDLFTSLPEKAAIFLISNIYTIRCNINANNVQIIYFI